VDSFKKHQILFNVDVCALHKTKALKRFLLPGEGFRYIIFNFPHVGHGIKDEERNILANQQLLQAIFTECIPYCRQKAPPDHILHGRNDDDRQPGELHVTLKEYHPYTLWEPKKLAQRAGWRTKVSYRFDPTVFEGYAHRRTLGFKPGQSAEANEEVAKGARTFCFERQTDTVIKPIPQPSAPLRTTKKRALKKDDEEESSDAGPTKNGQSLEESKAIERKKRRQQSLKDKEAQRRSKRKLEA